MLCDFLTLLWGKPSSDFAVIRKVISHFLAFIVKLTTFRVKRVFEIQMCSNTFFLNITADLERYVEIWFGY